MRFPKSRLKSDYNLFQKKYKKYFHDPGAGRGALPIAPGMLREGAISIVFFGENPEDVQQQAAAFTEEISKL